MKVSLKEHLYRKPYNFSFVQTVRLLYEMNPALLADCGEEVPTLLLFKSRVFVSAPPSDIFSIQKTPGKNGQSITHVHVNFIGIAGIQGPLPLPYTEMLLDRLRRKDRAFRDFLDIFNHRLLSLFYAIEKKYYPVLQNARPDQTTQGACLKALGGCNGPMLHTGLIPRYLLAYAGFFWQKPRNATALQAIIQDFFQARAFVTSFVGSWVPLQRAQRTYLGQNGSRLGREALLGTRAWCQNRGIAVCLELTEFETYLDFLPIAGQMSTSGFSLLKNLIAFYIGPVFGFRIQLLLTRRSKRFLGCAGSSLYLGWTSWLHQEGCVPLKQQAITVWESLAFRSPMR